jgi:hypothetical protein
MGYTHSWENKGHENDKENFKKVLEDAKKLYKNMPKSTDSAGGYSKNQTLKLCGGDGTGKPIFNENEIVFNGDNDLSHESFFITPYPIDFEFCKTARKPYDLMVCAVLISCKKHLVNFSYSSDGEEEEWEPAQKFYKEVCG